MNFSRFIILVCVPAFCSAWIDPCWDCPRQDEPAPFEKIYVCPNEILSTSQGIFYRAGPNQYIRTSAVRTDCYGMYVILIERQCPVCGERSYDNKAKEGYTCSYYQTEVYPNIWCDDYSTSKSTN